MTQYEVVGIGNAVVDVISHADDSFLADNGIEKGIMQLIERDRAEDLYAAMQDRVQTPGGSVANTVAGAGALGLKTAFIGRVRDDELGQFYAKAMTDIGIDFVNAPVAEGENPTSRCMIFVTPDGERSLNTYLGISTGLTSADVPQAVTEKAKLMFLEGYLFDHEAGKTAFREAARRHARDEFPFLRPDAPHEFAALVGLGLIAPLDALGEGGELVHGFAADGGEE